MKNKKWVIWLYIILIAALIGWSCYSIFVTKDFGKRDIVKAVGLLLSAAFGIAAILSGKRKGTVVNKSSAYEKAYGQFIGKAFENSSKEKKLFYRSLDDYNRNDSAAAIKKLLALREQCRGSAEQRTISFFLGLNYENLKHYEEAVQYYTRCVNIIVNAVAYDNLARCYDKLGNHEQAIEAYKACVRTDPKYACGYNNFGQFYIKLAEYDEALVLLEKAHELDGAMVPAIVGMAVCHSMLGNEEAFERYYHKAVASGYDGKKLMRFVRSLKAEFDE